MSLEGQVELTVDREHALHSIARTKKKARSELKTEAAWSKNEFHLHPAWWDGRDVRDHPFVQRIDYQTVDEVTFARDFEAANKPCIICNAMTDWPAVSEWTLPKLAKRFAREKFKCGEDDDGYAVKLRLEYYHLYQEVSEDDSPLYIFDGTFGDKSGKKSLLSDYELPKYFREDLFQYGGEDRRPPYRWVVIGPRRSGTGIHIDPLGTSAWNALISGRKRWCVFPPQTPKEVLKVPKHLGDSEAISWFVNMIPRVRLDTWPHAKPIEFIQNPGEIVFIPSGWHHVVLNITDTVAVTQNFCSTTNFPIVWRRTVRGRPKFSQKLLSRLLEVRPDLVKRAADVELDKDDGLPMSSSSDDSSSSSSSEDEKPTKKAKKTTEKKKKRRKKKNTMSSK